MPSGYCLPHSRPRLSISFEGCPLPHVVHKAVGADVHALRVLPALQQTKAQLGWVACAFARLLGRWAVIGLGLASRLQGAFNSSMLSRKPCVLTCMPCGHCLPHSWQGSQGLKAASQGVVESCTGSALRLGRRRLRSASSIAASEPELDPCWAASRAAWCHTLSSKV